MVGRDPENDCHFKPCPEGLEEAVEELKDEEAVAGGGEAMEKKTDNDEKKEDKLVPPIQLPLSVQSTCYSFDY